MKPSPAGGRRRLPYFIMDWLSLIVTLPLATGAASGGRFQAVALSPAQLEWVRPLLSARRAAPGAEHPLWPGYSPLFMPMLLHFEDAGGSSKGTSVLLGHPSPPEDFRPLPGDRRQASSEGVDVAVKPADSLDLAAPFGEVKLNGTPTFVWRIPAGRAASDELPTLVHENFHFFQRSWRADGRSRLAGGPARAVPSSDAQADATIEQMLLGRAVAAAEGGDRAAREFATLRALRLSAGSPANARWEAYQEAVEGMAALVEYRFVEERLAPGAKPGELLRDHVLAKLFEGLDRPGTEAKFRFYGSGAAQGLLLDRAGVRWRERVAAGAPVFEVFKQVFPPLPDAGAVAATLRRRYHHAALAAMAGARGAEEAAERQRLRGMFSRFEGLKLVLRGTRMSTAGASEGAAALFEDGSLAEADVTEEAPWDGTESLCLAGAAKFSRRGPPATVEVLLGPEQATRVTVDGKDAGGRGDASFRALEIRSPRAHLRLARPGTFRRRGSVLMVDVPERGAAR